MFTELNLQHFALQQKNLVLIKIAHSSWVQVQTRIEMVYTLMLIFQILFMLNLSGVHQAKKNLWVFN